MEIPSFTKPKFRDPNQLMDSVRGCWLPPEHLRLSPIDYAEKFVRIKDLADREIQFQRNPVQKLYLEMKDQAPAPKANGKRFIVLKARRMGLTTVEQALSYSLCRTKRNTKCVTVGPIEDDTAEIYSMVKLMHDRDPNYAKLDKNSVDAIAYKSLRSEFFIGTARGVSFGRGFQLSRVHCSEVAFWDMSERKFSNLMDAIDAAAKLGEIVLESTANGIGGHFYDMWQEAYSGVGKYHPIFLGWYLDSRNQIPISEQEKAWIIDTIEEEEIALVEQHKCNINQLAWRRATMGWTIEKRSPTKKARQRFKQEFPASSEEAFIASGSTYFNSDTLDTLLIRCKEPIRETDGLAIWKNPEPGHKYVLGADTSEGMSESDPTPYCILDVETGEQVLRYNGCLRPNRLGEKTVEWAKKYNGALIAIENNNTGHSAINTVMNQCMYSNVYYHEDLVSEDPSESKTPGWRTTAKTKPILLNDLDDALENSHMIVNDKLFLTQCRAYSNTGEAKRGEGHHGDIVIAWGIAWQARKKKQSFIEPFFA